MAKQDEVYIISEEDILEPLRKKPGTPRKSRWGFPTRVEEGTPKESTQEARRGRTSSSGGTRALVASTLSLFVCGAGQMYNGQGKLGLLLFLTEVLAVISHWSLIKLWPLLKDLGYIFAISEWEIFLFLAVADFLLVFFMLYNVAQAYHRAETEGRPFQGFRSPFLSGLASLLVPGWGQLLNAQLGKALFFLFFLLTETYVVALLMISPFFRLLADIDLDQFLTRRVSLAGMGVVFVASLMWILSVYDAILVARYRRWMA